MSNRLILTLAIIGGTGKEGQGLAYRWAQAGYHVIIGSRTPDKAERVASEVNERFDRPLVEGMGNAEAVVACDIAVLTVPFEAHRKTLEGLRDQLQGKILIDVSVPTGRGRVVEMPPAGSASQQAQEILGEGGRVVTAFQSISHTHLATDGPVPCDVLICGDDEEAKEQVLQLVKAAGLVGWDAGPMGNAGVVEGLALILLWINKRHRIKSAGIRITGEQKPE